MKLSTAGNNISHLSNQRHRIAFHKGTQFSIMVCGESGVGKTTFINTLFQTTLKEPRDQDSRYKKQLSQTIDIEETRTGKNKSIFLKPFNLHLLEIIEQQFKVNLNIIDTPGLGDYINSYHSWNPIIDYIDHQHERFMRQEQQPDRTQKEDHRVHVCLYFIRPTGGR